MANIFSKIGDYLTDEDFLAGVATGVSKTIERDEARREKAIDRLQTWALNKANRAEEKYQDELKENTEQVKLLAAKLATPENPVNSQPVLAASQFLIQQYGLAGAQAQADKLRAEQEQFNIEPIRQISVQAKGEGKNLTFGSISSGLTAKPAKIKVTDSGIDVKPTFLDRLFGGETVEAEVQASLDNLTSVVSEETVIPILAATGYNPDLIIRGDVDPKTELTRFKEIAKNMDPSSQEMQLVKDKIAVLQDAERQARIASATPFKQPEAQRYTNSIVNDIGNIYSLKTKAEILGGEIGPTTFEESTDATIEAMQVAQKMTQDLNLVKKSGNSDVHAEYSKLQKALFSNIGYTLVENEYGIMSISLADEDTPLFKSSYFKNKLSGGGDKINDQGSNSGTGQGSGGDESGSDADAYTTGGSSGSQNTTIKSEKYVTTDAVTAAVEAYKQLPDSVGGLERSKARRAVQDALKDANPDISVLEAMAQTKKLIGS